MIKKDKIKKEVKDVFNWMNHILFDEEDDEVIIEEAKLEKINFAEPLVDINEPEKEKIIENLIEEIPVVEKKEIEVSQEVVKSVKTNKKEFNINYDTVNTAKNLVNDFKNKRTDKTKNEKRLTPLRERDKTGNGAPLNVISPMYGTPELVEKQSKVTINLQPSISNKNKEQTNTIISPMVGLEEIKYIPEEPKKEVIRKTKTTKSAKEKTTKKTKTESTDKVNSNKVLTPFGL